MNINQRTQEGWTVVHAFASAINRPLLALASPASDGEFTRVKVDIKFPTSSIRRTLLKLVGMGALVNLPDRRHRTPMHLAVSVPYINLSQLQRTQSAHSFVDRQIIQKLFEANAELLQALMTCGADLSARDMDGHNYLHCAVVHNYLPPLQLFIDFFNR